MQQNKGKVKKEQTLGAAMTKGRKWGRNADTAKEDGEEGESQDEEWA